jgi:hypothetical protein
LTDAAAEPRRTFQGAPRLLGPDERLVWTPESLDRQHRAPPVLSLPPTRQALAFLDDSGGLSPLAIDGIVVLGMALAVRIYYLHGCVARVSLSAASARLRASSDAIVREAWAPTTDAALARRHGSRRVGLA